jgi:hypothetical protein
MQFEILGDISEVETFATGSGIRELTRLRKIQDKTAPLRLGYVKSAI